MSKKTPLVSVVIPYFKKRKYIKKTLNSVIKQKYKNIEVIIVYDDTDLKDLNYIKSQLSNFKKKKIVINSKNIGAGFSRNKGIKVSRGKYLAFIDADDTWKKKKLLFQINFMIKNNFLATHTDYEIISNKKKFFRQSKDYNTFKQLIRSCDIGLSTVVLHKKILKNLNFPNIKTKEDYVLWLNILKKGYKFKSIKKSFTIWKETKNSLSSNPIQKLKDGYLVYNKYMKFNVIKSFYCLIRLSFNFVLKKYFMY